ncbi:MAG: hypothetical protein PHD87_02805 [Candidatus Cloacimonetes bacterium]|nr:hypothetical protein [Candidatus Cloacimonadota bacterium]
MKTFSLITLFTLAAALLGAGAWQWAEGFGSQAMESAWDLAVHPFDMFPQDIWVCGEFTDSLTLGGVSYPSQGLSDCFVAKFGTDGSLHWVRTFGSNDGDVALSIAADQYGNCYFIGFCTGQVVFNGQAYPHAGMWDVFYGKLDPAGDLLWFKTFGGPLNDMGYGIETALDGSIYLTGWFADTIVFTDSISLSSFGGSDIFLLRCDTDGNPLWARHAGGPGVEYGYKVDTFSTDTWSCAYITGSASPGSDFGGIITDAEGMFVACYESDGSTAWVLPSYGVGALNIAADNHLSPTINAVIGRVTGTGMIGDTVLTSVNGSDDIYIAHFDAVGNWLDVQQYGGPGSDKGRAVDIRGVNWEISLSSYEDEVAFGNHNLVSNGNWDIVMMDEYRPPVSAGSLNSDVGTDIKWLGEDKFVVTGWFSGVMRFGQHILDSGSDTNMDSFVAVYDYLATETDDPALVPARELTCHPNPGTDRFYIAAKNAEAARIYNLRGQLLRCLESDAKLEGSFVWDATDQNGIRCPAGVYLVKAGAQTGKLLLLDR